MTSTADVTHKGASLKASNAVEDGLRGYYSRYSREPRTT
jgi:hypothetical protein